MLLGGNQQSALIQAARRASENVLAILVASSPDPGAVGMREAGPMRMSHAPGVRREPHPSISTDSTL